MARTQEDISRYVRKSGLTFREELPGTWRLSHASWGEVPIFVQFSDPLVIFRCTLFELPEMDADELTAMLSYASFAST